MKYLLYTRAEFLRGLRYRANYWATLASSLIITAIQWSLWTAVYRNTDAIAGVSLATMMSYTLMGRVTAGFLGEPSNLRLGPRVRQGTIVHDLVKPADLHVQLLFQSLGSALFRWSRPDCRCSSCSLPRERSASRAWTLACILGISSWAM